MNKHQLDRLFEEKLGAVQQEPSDKAQARFDQLLAQKHKKPVLIWWRVAAAVLLLAVSTITYLNWPAGDQQPVIADLPESETSVPLVDNADPLASTTDDQELKSEQELLPTTANPEEGRNELMETEPVLAVNDQAEDEVEASSGAVAASPTVNDITDASTTIAVVENDKELPEATPDQDKEESISTEVLEEVLDSEVALAVNEPKTEEAAKKKRLPVTIIYKSSNADQSLIAMQDIRDDVDSLADERSNSLKSILQNAGNGSILAEFKKAKEDLFNLDISLKSKKVEN